MTSSPPIDFEPAGKPAPTRRDASSGNEGHSFADTMQTQRAADRATAATDKAGERNASAQKHAQAQSDAQAGTPAVDRPAANGARDGAAQAGKSGATNGDTAAASAQPPGKAAQKAAQGAARAAEQGAARTAEQAAGKAAQASGKAAEAAGKAATAGASGANAKAAAANAAQAATQAAAQASSGAAAAARGTTIDGQPVKAIVQDSRAGQARPVNAATAVAAQTATPASAASGKNGGGGDAKATDGTATAASTTKPAATGATQSDDPTAKALKEAFAGQREAGARRRDPESAEANAQRHETRPTGQRAAGGGMSPALRAAAEAVQQQLSGNGTGTAGNPGTSANQTGGQSVQQMLRTDAAAAQTAGSGQTFDPVLQNTGPQPGGAGQSGSLAAAGKTAPTAGTGAGNPAPTTPPAEQVAVQIQRAAAQGQSRVQIRLNPAELGRIDVKLEVGDDGHVRAALAVDKPDTLDMMQRDPRALERALQAAGLKTDQGSLSFNLRDNGNGTGQPGTGDGRNTPARGSGAQAADDTPIPAEQLRASLPADGRIDIRV